jgi:ABC-2 type transport system ATP-binding protein
MTNPVDIQDLTVTFASRSAMVTALQEVSLTVPSGQVFGFLGPNGAGKTTTMHVLLGFVEATSGTARIFGEDVRRSVARQRIGFLPEHPDTYSFLTGRELLGFAGRLFGMPRNLIRERTEQLLGQVDMVAAADRRIGTYSRGMMQRICLAQALVNDPDLVILDEPTGGLDPLGRLSIREIIADLKARGKTVFFSSHELSEVERVCDTVAILAGGRVVAQGSVDELVQPGQSLERYFLDEIRKQTGGGV